MWPREESNISGSVMPFVALAQSRYVFTAMTIDSVPPDVVHPAPVGLLYILRTMATISASILRTAGKTSGCRGFETQYRSYAATMTFCKSSPPSTRNCQSQVQVQDTSTEIPCVRNVITAGSSRVAT